MNNYVVNEKNIGRVGKLKVFFAITMLFLTVGIAYGVVSQEFSSIITGLADITLSPTILITDFLMIGGISSTFINVALVGLLNLYIINHYKLKFNGVLIAAFFTVLGFSFFGKNMFNILPIYFGGYLYTKYQKISFKDIIVVIMFGTALAPMISEISFAGIIPPPYGILTAALVGVFIGFVIVPLSSHMLKFHDGYNLYNIGFTAGIIGTVLTSILRSFGIEIEPVYIVSEENSWVIIMTLIIVFTFLLGLGFYIKRSPITNYLGIFKYKGRLITDFTHLVGYGMTFINMSVLGFFCLGYVIFVGGVFNGPVIAGIFTVVGFGAFGKHLKNILPVMLGVIFTASLLGYDLGATTIIISVLFSTTLAPIAGKYGPAVGFGAGILHMFLVTNVGLIHGGINLYNNGFSGGIVASVVIPIVDAFKKER